LNHSITQWGNIVQVQQESSVKWVNDVLHCLARIVPVGNLHPGYEMAGHEL
jgi:hypothetical protein